MSYAKPRIVAFHPAGKQIAADKAEPYGRELLRIEREHGNLEPATIVDAAKAKSSPIHDAFTWSDSEAAKKCRLLEAGELRRSIEVDVRMPDGSVSEGLPITTAIRVRVIEGGKERIDKRVESIVTVLADPVKSRSAVDECAAQFIALRHRWDSMKAASESALGRVISAVDAMEAQVSLGAAM